MITKFSAPVDQYWLDIDSMHTVFIQYEFYFTFQNPVRRPGFTPNLTGSTKNPTRISLAVGMRVSVCVCECVSSYHGIDLQWGSAVCPARFLRVVVHEDDLWVPQRPGAAERLGVVHGRSPLISVVLEDRTAIIRTQTFTDLQRVE